MPLAALLAGALLSVGCGAKPAPVGVSTASPAPVRPKQPAPNRPKPVAGLVNFRAEYTKVTSGVFRSRGHALGRFEADIYVSPEAAAAYLAGQPLPEGARVVMDHRENSEPGPVYGIAFEGGRARFLAAGPDGTLAPEAALTPCVRCHEDAPKPPLFRIIQ